MVSQNKKLARTECLRQTDKIQPMDQGIIYACKAYYHSEPLVGIVNSVQKVTEHKTLTLEDAAYYVGLTFQGRKFIKWQLKSTAKNS
jgi:hypothetical protein